MKFNNSNYYCPLNPKTSPQLSEKQKCGFRLIMDKPPLSKNRLLRRCFRYLSKHMVQVCVWLIEEFT